MHSDTLLAEMAEPAAAGIRLSSLWLSEQLAAGTRKSSHDSTPRPEHSAKKPPNLKNEASDLKI